MLCKFAVRYALGNDAARDDLIDFGILALYEFLKKHESRLCPELFESKDFTVAVYNHLWSKIGYEAARLSRRSALFSDLKLKNKDRETDGKGIEVKFYCEMDADAAYCEDKSSGGYFDEYVEDSRSADDAETAELMYDVSRCLMEEEYVLFSKYFDGAKVTDLAAEYGVSPGTVSKRLAKIRKKLAPLGESLRAA